MPKSTNKSTDTIEIEIPRDEFRLLILDAAVKEINKEHMVGNFKPVLVAPDGYGGFKIIFLKINDKKFAEVEPLDF